MTKHKFKIGDIVRYGVGPTALMEIVFVAELASGAVHYYGNQCAGGVTAICSASGDPRLAIESATASDLKEWAKNAPLRKPKPKLRSFRSEPISGETMIRVWSPGGNSTTGVAPAKMFNALFLGESGHFYEVVVPDRLEQLEEPEKTAGALEYYVEPSLSESMYTDDFALLDGLAAQYNLAVQRIDSFRFDGQDAYDN